jgi:hypothetical protein
MARTWCYVIQEEKASMKNDRMKQTGKTNESSPPLPFCPGCGMVKNEWPGEGYTHEGQSYCCQGCAEGTGCTCKKVKEAGFSREGQERTRAQPRPGEQRAGAPAPSGELNGERDSRGTEEAIDQAG